MISEKILKSIEAFYDQLQNINNLSILHISGNFNETITLFALRRSRMEFSLLIHTLHQHKRPRVSDSQT